jgi:hypothetical protein
MQDGPADEAPAILSAPPRETWFGLARGRKGISDLWAIEGPNRKRIGAADELSHRFLATPAVVGCHRISTVTVGFSLSSYVGDDRSAQYTSGLLGHWSQGGGCGR